MVYNIILSDEGEDEEKSPSQCYVYTLRYRNVCVCHCQVIYTCRSILRAFFWLLQQSSCNREVSIRPIYMIRFPHVNMSVSVYLLRKYVQCLTSNALPFAFKLSHKTQYCNTKIIEEREFKLSLPVCVCLILCRSANERQTLLSLKIEIRVYSKQHQTNNGSYVLNASKLVLVHFKRHT